MKLPTLSPERKTAIETKMEEARGRIDAKTETLLQKVENQLIQATGSVPVPLAEEVEGATRIARARDVTSDAVSKAYEEVASRVMRLAETNLKRAEADKVELLQMVDKYRATVSEAIERNLNRAQNDLEGAEKFAGDWRTSGEEVVRAIEASLNRATTAAATLATTRRLLEGFVPPTNGGNNAPDNE